MARDGLLLSNNSRGYLFIVVAVMALSACARSAPTLPAIDQTSQPEPSVLKSPSELSQKCEAFEYRLSELRKEEEQLNFAIKIDRGKNQVAGYMGAFLIVPYLATEHHVSEKQRLDAIQVERDGIYQEMKSWRCPSPKQ